MRLCQCCKSFLATRYTKTLVPVCASCFMKLQPVDLSPMAQVEVSYLEDMWKLDGSWVKEGAVRR